MGILRKKLDPISDRERQLKSEIAALEGQIQKLSTALDHQQNHPRLRSTVFPHSPTESPAAPSQPSEPVFEEIDHRRLKSPHTESTTQGHYNESGLRKYDLTAAWHRIRDFLRGPQPSNHKLLTLLAAGNVQGLRPLRYEKRIARNRLIFWVIILLLLLWGILSMTLRHR
jgi:hypothetical protein